MTENALVVVFPSIYSQKKLNLLISNIKKILNLENQKFGKISKDGSVIIVEANDPVFASSAINLLYGVEKIAIAKQIKNDFNSVVSSIAKISGNLLLKEETFLVKVEGESSGYLTKDVELAATSALIEKLVDQKVKPGTLQKHDKLLYTFLTKSHGYVCIFTDIGCGGIANNAQNEKIVCCIYDELSAISCLESIKQGFEVKPIICYRKQSDLMNLVKMLNHILPRFLDSKIELEFYRVNIKQTSADSYLQFVQVVTELLLNAAKLSKITKISLALSPLIFPDSFIDNICKKVFQKGFLPWIPLVGLDKNIFDNAKQVGMSKYISKIEKLAKTKFNDSFKQKETSSVTNQAIKTKQSVSVKVGPNNIHDILDSLEIKH